MIELQFFGMIIAVAIAGGIGSVLRFFIGQWQGKLPWGILLGNVVASFLVGLIVGNVFSLILITGLAGGLSTFSSFAAQTVEFLRRGRIAQALLNVLANLLLSSTGVALGAWLSTALLK